MSSLISRDISLSYPEPKTTKNGPQDKITEERISDSIDLIDFAISRTSAITSKASSPNVQSIMKSQIPDHFSEMSLHQSQILSNNTLKASPKNPEFAKGLDSSFKSENRQSQRPKRNNPKLSAMGKAACSSKAANENGIFGTFGENQMSPDMSCAEFGAKSRDGDSWGQSNIHPSANKFGTCVLASPREQWDNRFRSPNETMDESVLRGMEEHLRKLKGNPMTQSQPFFQALKKEKRTNLLEEKANLNELSFAGSSVESEPVFGLEEQEGFEEEKGNGSSFGTKEKQRESDDEGILPTFCTRNTKKPTQFQAAADVDSLKPKQFEKARPSSMKLPLKLSWLKSDYSELEKVIHPKRTFAPSFPVKIDPSHLKPMNPMEKSSPAKKTPQPNTKLSQDDSSFILSFAIKSKASSKFLIPPSKTEKKTEFLEAKLQKEKNNNTCFSLPAFHKSSFHQKEKLILPRNSTFFFFNADHSDSFQSKTHVVLSFSQENKHVSQLQRPPNEIWAKMPSVIHKFSGIPAQIKPFPIKSCEHSPFLNSPAETDKGICERKAIAIIDDYELHFPNLGFRHFKNSIGSLKRFKRLMSEGHGCSFFIDFLPSDQPNPSIVSQKTAIILSNAENRQTLGQKQADGASYRKAKDSPKLSQLAGMSSQTTSIFSLSESIEPDQIILASMANAIVSDEHTLKPFQKKSLNVNLAPFPRDQPPRNDSAVFNQSPKPTESKWAQNKESKIQKDSPSQNCQNPKKALETLMEEESVGPKRAKEPIGMAKSQRLLNKESLIEESLAKLGEESQKPKESALVKGDSFAEWDKSQKDGHQLPETTIQKRFYEWASSSHADFSKKPANQTHEMSRFRINQIKSEEVGRQDPIHLEISFKEKSEEVKRSKEAKGQEQEKQENSKGVPSSFVNFCSSPLPLSPFSNLKTREYGPSELLPCRVLNEMMEGPLGLIVESQVAQKPLEVKINTRQDCIKDLEASSDAQPSLNGFYTDSSPLKGKMDNVTTNSSAIDWQEIKGRITMDIGGSELHLELIPQESQKPLRGECLNSPGMSSFFRDTAATEDGAMTGYSTNHQRAQIIENSEIFDSLNEEKHGKTRSPKEQKEELSSFGDSPSSRRDFIQEEADEIKTGEDTQENQVQIGRKGTKLKAVERNNGKEFGKETEDATMVSSVLDASGSKSEFSAIKGDQEKGQPAIKAQEKNQDDLGMGRNRVVHQKEELQKERNPEREMEKGRRDPVVGVANQEERANAGQINLRDGGNSEESSTMEKKRSIDTESLKESGLIDPQSAKGEEAGKEKMGGNMIKNKEIQKNRGNDSIQEKLEMGTPQEREPITRRKGSEPSSIEIQKKDEALTFRKDPKAQNGGNETKSKQKESFKELIHSKNEKNKHESISPDAFLENDCLLSRKSSKSFETSNKIDQNKRKNSPNGKPEQTETIAKQEDDENSKKESSHSYFNASFKLQEIMSGIPSINPKGFSQFGLSQSFHQRNNEIRDEYFSSKPKRARIDSSDSPVDSSSRITPIVSPRQGNTLPLPINAPEEVNSAKSKGNLALSWKNSKNSSKGNGLSLTGSLFDEGEHGRKMKRKTLKPSSKSFYSEMEKPEEKVMGMFDQIKELVKEGSCSPDLLQGILAQLSCLQMKIASKGPNGSQDRDSMLDSIQRELREIKGTLDTLCKKSQRQDKTRERRDFEETQQFPLNEKRKEAQRNKMSFQGVMSQFYDGNGLSRNKKKFEEYQFYPEVTRNKNYLENQAKSQKKMAFKPGPQPNKTTKKSDLAKPQEM